MRFVRINITAAHTSCSPSSRHNDQRQLLYLGRSVSCQAVSIAAFRRAHSPNFCVLWRFSPHCRVCWCLGQRGIFLHANASHRFVFHLFKHATAGSNLIPDPAALEFCAAELVFHDLRPRSATARSAVQTFAVGGPPAVRAADYQLRDIFTKAVISHSGSHSGVSAR